MIALPFVSLQFARLYPLNQLDLPVEKKHVDFGPLMAQGAKIVNPSRDYTPPSEPLGVCVCVSCFCNNCDDASSTCYIPTTNILTDCNA